ncbi:hypothetical protein [Desulfosporosinus sp. HMP52]|nr:hypothetical protein [Desulfosporosinus sp. HMP52]
MSLRVKVSDFFLDHHGPELLLVVSCVVLIILIIRDVIAVF